MMGSQHFVYIIRSRRDPTRYYTGLTSDVTERVAAHNAGRCPHTANAKPWVIVVAVEFADEQRAIAFERYLKSGSGAAFSKRYRLPFACSTLQIRPPASSVI